MLFRRALVKSGRRRTQIGGGIVLASTATVLAVAVPVHEADSMPTWPLPKFLHRTANTAGEGPKVKVSIHAARGPRASMEDRWFVSEDLKFFAVYDGHGGYRVAEHAQRNLYDEFIKQLEEVSPVPSSSVENDASDGKPGIVEKVATTPQVRLSDDPKHIEQAFMKSFDTISRKVLSTTYLDLEGSTAVAVFVGDNNLIAANLGDSRAIMCRGAKAVPLTIDHKPDSVRERKRIEDMGGRVKWHGYLGPDKLPVPGMGAYRINGNLAVSRALGDRLERPYVSSDPDIFIHPRNIDEDRFIVLASDGLWDVMSSQEVVDFVKQILAGSMSVSPSGPGGRQKQAIVPHASSSASMSPSKKRDAIRNEMDKRQENMAQFVVEEALRRGSADNVTVLVVWLR